VLPSARAASAMMGCLFVWWFVCFRFTVCLQSKVLEAGARLLAAARGMATGWVLGAVAVRPCFEVPVSVVRKAADPLHPRGKSVAIPPWQRARALGVEHVRALQRPIVGACRMRPEHADKGGGH
jgi:hypothetical protein